MNKINTNRKTKIFLLILVVTSMFVFPLLAKAITFDSNTYVEMVPAIKGTACLLDNNGICISGNDKDILIGMTFVYPSQDDSQRATPSVIPLVKLDEIMYRATSGGCDDASAEYVNGTHLYTGKMSTLNSDGSEVPGTAKVNCTLNAKDASFSDFSIFIGGDIYKLNSILATKKIVGNLASDNFVTSTNLLSTKLTCRTMEEVEFPGVAQKSLPDVTREMSCNYNLIGLGDSRAFLNWGDGTQEEVFPYFYDISKEHKYQESGGTYDVTLKLVSSSGQEMIANTVQVQLPSL